MFKLVWTSKYAQICDLSISVENEPTIVYPKCKEETCPAGAKCIDGNAQNFEPTCDPSNLSTLDGAELFAKAKMIGGEYSSDYKFNKAFDSNKNRDENSLYHSLVASESSPQGFEITFDTVTRIHEIVIMPRKTTGQGDKNSLEG